MRMIYQTDLISSSKEGKGMIDNKRSKGKLHLRILPKDDYILAEDSRKCLDVIKRLNYIYMKIIMNIIISEMINVILIYSDDFAENWNILVKNQCLLMKHPQTNHHQVSVILMMDNMKNVQVDVVVNNTKT